MEIVFAGAVSLQDFRRAQALDGRSRWFSLTMIGLVVVIVLSQSFFFLSDGFSLSLLTTFLPLLLMAVFFLVFMRFQIRKAWEQNQAIYAAISGTISKDSVQYNTAHSQSQSSWELFQKYKIAPDMVLLYQATAAFNVFPRHFFRTDADWTAFTQLVQQHISKK